MDYKIRRAKSEFELLTDGLSQPTSLRVGTKLSLEGAAHVGQTCSMGRAKTRFEIRANYGDRLIAVYAAFDGYIADVAAKEQRLLALK